MQVNKYKLFLLLFVVLLISSQMLFASPEVLVFEGEDGYPPYKFVQDDDLHGFEIDLNRHIFRSEDYKIKYSKNSWYKVYTRLKNGEIDTCGLIAVNEERKQEVLFSQAVLSSYISIYSKKDMPRITLDDLKKYRVGVGKGQYTETILLKDVGIKDYVTFITIEDAVNALSKGDIDILFENQEVVNYYLIEMGLKGKIVPQQTNLFPVDVAYGVRKGNPQLVDYINKRLDMLRKKGVYEELYRKYFFEPSKYHKESQRNKAIIAVLCVLVLFILLQVYIRYLKKKVLSTYRKLQRQHEWLRITLSSIGDAVITTDEKGIVTFTNFEAQRLFGVGEDELTGKKLEEVLAQGRDDSGNPYRIPIEQVINQGMVVSLEDSMVLIVEGEA
ncbi:MAG: transporter substrate-binding domain-containing protein, partial [Bacillota bacterium]